MKFRKIFICKPGCDLQPKPNKTNLQIREMEALKYAFADAGGDAELTTIPDILQNGLALENCAVICFNSAKRFDDELIQLIKLASILDNIDITLVSNDVRLNFKIYEGNEHFVDRLIKHVIEGSAHVRVLTNASIRLDEYVHEVLDWPNADAIPVYYSSLWTLPAFLPGQKHADKVNDIVYTCMHFCDYSEQRKSELIALKTAFGDRLTLSGDMTDMIVDGKQVPSVVTDTAEVWQWYRSYRVTPVLLEPRYDYYGVMPNRVSEGIACRCIPVLLTADSNNFAHMSDINLPVVQGDINAMIDALQNYVNQYDTPAVKQLLDRQQKSLGMHRTLLCQQLMTMYLK